MTTEAKQVLLHSAQKYKVVLMFAYIATSYHNKHYLRPDEIASSP